MSAPGQFLIYALLDPRFKREDPKAWKYIGQSTVGMKRPKQHRYRLTGTHKKAVWLRELAALDLEYVIVILRELPDGDPVKLAQAERELIALGRSEGLALLNVSDGGEYLVGNMRGRFHTPAARAKMRARIAQTRKPGAKKAKETGARILDLMSVIAGRGKKL